MEIAVGGYGHFGDISAHEHEDFWTFVRGITFGGNLGKHLTSDRGS